MSHCFYHSHSFAEKLYEPTKGVKNPIVHALSCSKASVHLTTAFILFRRWQSSYKNSSISSLFYFHDKEVIKKRAIG